MTQAFREIPYGPGNPTPLNQDYVGVKPSQIHNVSREIGRNAQVQERDLEEVVVRGWAGGAPPCYHYITTTTNNNNDNNDNQY